MVKEMFAYIGEVWKNIWKVMDVVREGIRRNVGRQGREMIYSSAYKVDMLYSFPMVTQQPPQKPPTAPAKATGLEERCCVAV